MPLTMLGITIRMMTVIQPAPSERAASASVVTSMAWQGRVDRAVGVGQHQDDVDEHEHLG